MTFKSKKAQTSRGSDVDVGKYTTYMNWHVEVVRFERVCHLPECTQRIVPVCLFEPESLVRFAAFLQVQLNTGYMFVS